MFLSSVEGGSQRGSESEKKRVHRTETDMCVVLFMSMTYSTHTHIKTVVKHRCDVDMTTGCFQV